MAGEKKTFSWLIAGALFLCFAALIVSNLLRYQCNDLKTSLLPSLGSSLPAEEALAAYAITSKGLLLGEYQSLGLVDLPLGKRDRFSLTVRFSTPFFAGAFLSLADGPTTLTFDVDGDFNKGEPITLSLVKEKERMDLFINDRSQASRSVPALDRPRFGITSLDSQLAIRSIDVISDSRQPIYHRSFVPRLAGPVATGFTVFLVFLGFIVLAVLDRRPAGAATPEPSAGRVLLFTTPIWAGTLMPVQLSLSIVFTFFIAVSLALFVFFRNRDRLEKLRLRAGITLLPIALIGLGILLFARFPAGIATLCLAAGAGLLILSAWAMGKADRRPIGAGLGYLIAPLAVAAAWPLARIAGRIGTDPVLGLNDRGGLTAALLLVSSLMLLQILLSARHRISGYTPLILLLLIGSMGMAELTLRLSSLEPLLRPHGEKAAWQDNPLLSLLQDAARDAPFRSGPVAKQPAPGITRILVLGGSTTYGFGIETNESTFSGCLQACLNEGETGTFEVINAGARGFNLFFLLRNFETFGLAYHPRWVILYINALDSVRIEGPLTLHELWDMNPASREKLVRSWIDPAPSGDTKTSRDGTWIASLQRLFSRLRLYDGLVRMVSSARSDSLKPLALWSGALKDINPPEDYRKNLQRLISLCAANRIDLVLVNEFDPFNAAEKNPKRSMLEAIMKEEANKGDVPYFDLQAEFLSRPDAEDLFFDEPMLQFHYNPQGHQAVGERLCAWMSESMTH